MAAATLERKILPVEGFKVLDAEQGIVETMVAVTGVVDDVNDRIVPGALAESKIWKAGRRPLGVWSHDWKTPVSKPLEIKELLPGDSALPSETHDGKPWPNTAGAIVVKAQYNLETEAGRDAYSWARFLGTDQAWSIGYSAERKSIDRKTGVRDIHALALYEYSQVMQGANGLARTLSVKDLAAHYEGAELEPEHAAQVKAMAEAAEDATPEEVDQLMSGIKTSTPDLPKSSIELKDVLAALRSLGVEVPDDLAAGVRPPEVKLARVETERKAVYTYVDGSHEQRLDQVRRAVRANTVALGGVDSFDATAIGTFDDRVVVEVGVRGGPVFYEVPYSIGDDGVVLGTEEMTEVSVAAAVSVKELAPAEVMSELRDVLAEAKDVLAAIEVITEVSDPGEESGEESGDSGDSGDSGVRIEQPGESVEAAEDVIRGLIFGLSTTSV